MFQPGDKLTYHGRVTHACDIIFKDPRSYGDPSEWIFESATSNAGTYGRIVRCWNPTGTVYSSPKSPMSFYEVDFELAVTGPEPYEEWFKA